MSYDFSQRHSDEYDPEPEDKPRPGIDYDEGECMLCGSSAEHDVNECLRNEFEECPSCGATRRDLVPGSVCEVCGHVEPEENNE